MAKQQESRIVTRIRKGLKREFGNRVRTIKYHGGFFTEDGVSDILGCIDGRFFALEVKRPKVGRVSDLQLDFIREIKEAGGIAEVVTSLEEARDALIPAINPTKTKRISELRSKNRRIQKKIKKTL